MKVDFLDRTSLWMVVEDHPDWEDSYSLADVFNEILQVVQMDIADGTKTVSYDADGNIDLIKTAGVKSINWDTEPYCEAKFNDKVEEFIQCFHHFEHDMTATFTMCCCYWFAIILHHKFPDSRIMVAEERINPKKTPEEVERLRELGFSGHLLAKLTEGRSCALHFVTEIDGREYDITGDVTGKYVTSPWDEYPDGPKKDYIVDSCINML